MQGTSADHASGQAAGRREPGRGFRGFPKAAGGLRGGALPDVPTLQRQRLCPCAQSALTHVSAGYNEVGLLLLETCSCDSSLAYGSACKVMQRMQRVGLPWRAGQCRLALFCKMQL